MLINERKAEFVAKMSQLEDDLMGISRFHQKGSDGCRSISRRSAPRKGLTGARWHASMGGPGTPVLSLDVDLCFWSPSFQNVFMKKCYINVNTL